MSEASVLSTSNKKNAQKPVAEIPSTFRNSEPTSQPKSNVSKKPSAEEAPKRPFSSVATGTQVCSQSPLLS